MTGVLAGVAFLLLGWGPLAVLTAIGGRRRGSGLLLASLGGVLFPLTWVRWYVLDELLPRRARADRQGTAADHGHLLGQ